MNSLGVPVEMMCTPREEGLATLQNIPSAQATHDHEIKRTAGLLSPLFLRSMCKSRGIAHRMPEPLKKQEEDGGSFVGFRMSQQPATILLSKTTQPLGWRCQF